MEFSACAAGLTLHTVPHMLNRHGERIKLVVSLFREGPQLVCDRILDDNGTRRGRPEGRLRVVGDAVDNTRRYITRVRALAVARVEALVLVLNQVTFGLHCVGETIRDAVADASTLEVGIVLRRAEQFLEGVASEKVPGALDVAVRISHSKLALAADALGVVVSFAIHTVDAHFSFWIGAIFTLDAGTTALCDGTSDTVKAVGTCLAFVADSSAFGQGVGAFPARHALAVRGAVRVLANGAIDTS